MDGALRFARYALPPNRLGYCGPGDSGALFEQAVALAADEGTGPGRAEVLDGLRALAEGFEGAWPYLELLAGAAGTDDPLDDEVVSSYWLGGPLLEQVGALAAGNHVEDRFRPRAGRWWAEVSAALEPGALLSHAFHVFVVGPWVGMMRAGRVEVPLQVMDRCRVRAGRVLEVHGDTAVVRCEPLELAGGRLGTGPAVTEVATLGTDGHHPCGPVMPGDVVSLHWDWVCEVLGATELDRLRAYSTRALTAANRSLGAPGAGELG